MPAQPKQYTDMTFKKLTTLFSNETKQIDAVQMWEVRWQALKGDYPWTTAREQLEAFTSEQQAQEFATSLKTAFSLLRQTAHTSVVVRKSASV